MWGLAGERAWWEMVEAILRGISKWKLKFIESCLYNDFSCEETIDQLIRYLQAIAVSPSRPATNEGNPDGG